MKLNKGYVKVNRKFFNDKFKGNFKLFGVYFYLKANANYGDKPIETYGRKPITLGPGQVVVNLRELSCASGHSFRTIKEYINCLETIGLLRIVETNVAQMLIQMCENAGRTNVHKKRTNVQPTPSKNEHLFFSLISRKETIGDKEKQCDVACAPSDPLSFPPKLESLPEPKLKKRKAPKKAKNPPPSDEAALAMRWYHWASERSPSTKFKLDSFVDAIGKIKRRRKCDTAHVERLFNFIIGDDFWSTNFKSPCTYGKVWSNGATKLDNAFEAMDKYKARSPGPVQPSPRVYESIDDFIAILGGDR